MVLTQSGENVSGTVSRTASFVVSDRGTITGTVVGNEFRFRWVNVTDYGGESFCSVVTTVITGGLTIVGTSMSGPTSSMIQPPCAARVSLGQSSWVKQ
jgi:hypothetical protein